MIQKCWFLNETCTDPYRNLATEKALMNMKECAVLYLWQNDHSIIIGKNQNPYMECRVEEFLKSGGKIARRYSGGGAVYHDLGNLNYTLILPKEEFDIPRQMAMVCRGLSYAGISGAEYTGRNDLVVDGRKCSGNAFQMTRENGCHHGTLLWEVHTEEMLRYLTADKSKLQKHGIKSVASRVMNLHDSFPDVQISDLKAGLLRAFSEEYGVPEKLPDNMTELADIERDAAFLKSDSWLYPSRLLNPVTLTASFDWGIARILLQLDGNLIRDAAIYTDSLDADLFPRIREWLLEKNIHDLQMNDEDWLDPSERKIAADIIACILTYDH